MLKSYRQLLLLPSKNISALVHLRTIICTLEPWYNLPTVGAVGNKRHVFDGTRPWSVFEPGYQYVRTLSSVFRQIFCLLDDLEHIQHQLIQIKVYTRTFVYCSPHCLLHLFNSPWSYVQRFSDHPISTDAIEEVIEVNVLSDVIEIRLILVGHKQCIPDYLLSHFSRRPDQITV